MINKSALKGNAMMVSVDKTVVGGRESQGGGKRPLVSFILPAYKRKHLKSAIDSIIAQTVQDFELVVVDDNSPENLADVVRCCDVRIKYYRNARNIGGTDLVAAWNHAMKYAIGEWCVLASDDDEYLPDYLEEMLRLACKYPKCDLFTQGFCMLMPMDAQLA